MQLNSCVGKTSIVRFFLINLFGVLGVWSSFSNAAEYSDYPVHKMLTNKVSKIEYPGNPDARAFRTRLQEAVGESADFAGSYRVISWGAGTMALRAALVEVKTGKVFLAPFTAALGLQYRANSRLMLENDPLEVSSYIKDHGGVKPAWLRTSYWLWDLKKECFTEIK